MSTSDTTTAILEVRVLHKRTYGALFFVDCLITNFAGKPFGMVSVRCTDNTTFSNCNSKDIKVGDVALIKGKRDMSETFKPRPPRLGFFQCEEFTITESWSQMVANPTNSQGKITFTWMHPRASFLGVTVEQLEKESLLQTTRRPIAFIQCTSAQCERVCDYFDGELPANTNKSRVVYIYDSDECPNQRWRDFLISPPEFLHGVIARVMLINKEISPSISLSGAVKTLSDLRRKSSRIPGDIYRDKRLSVFPKEVEVRIKKSNELYMHDHGDEPEDASISTREFLYDVICYSDGLYWIGHNVLRYLVPEDRCPAPSSAYFKLLEIKQRIPFHAEFLNKPWAVDVGASPGGWSYCCIKNFNISSVLAIDPATHMDDMLSDCGFEQHTHTNTEGKLSFKKRIIDSIKSPQIIHAIGKGGDVLDDVLSLSDDTNCPKFSIYVCDVNLEPVHAVDLVEKARPLLASPCLVVLTFKNNFRSKSKYTSHITPLLERLAGQGYLHEMDHMPEEGALLRHTIIAGGLSGLSEHIVMFPLDSVKTRMMSKEIGHLYPTLTVSAKKMYQEEGLWKGFYRGVWPASCAAIPAHAALFSAFEYFSNLTSKYTSNQATSTAVGGAAASVVHETVTVPFDVIKQRMQARQFNTAFDCVREISAKEGLLFPFYRSLPAALLIGIPAQIVHWLTYRTAKVVTGKTIEERMAADYFLCGGIAGVNSAFVTNPLDMIKTRIQLGAKSYTEAIKTIMSEGGLPKFWTGVVPRMLFAAPSAALTMTTYEVTMKYLVDGETNGSTKHVCHHT